MSRQEILKNVFLQLRAAGFVYNKGDFAHRLNYDPCHLSGAFSGSRSISRKLLNRILEIFPQVNASYLRTGIGNVLNTSGPRQNSGIILCDRQNQVDPLWESLLAERESLLLRLDQINQMISILHPRDMKSAS